MTISYVLDFGKKIIGKSISSSLEDKLGGTDDHKINIYIKIQCFSIDVKITKIQYESLEQGAVSFPEKNTWDIEKNFFNIKVNKLKTRQRRLNDLSNIMWQHNFNSNYFTYYIQKTLEIIGMGAF